MNVKEGMRRLGLVLGVLGAGAGTVFSYLQLQPLLVQRAQYRAFQTLVTSRIIQQEAESLKNALSKKAQPFAPPPPPPKCQGRSKTRPLGRRESLPVHGRERAWFEGFTGVAGA